MHTTKHIQWTAAIMLVGMAIAGCKKDNTSPAEVDFDINNAKDYYIYFKSVGDLQGTKHNLLDFMADGRVAFHTAQYEIITPYTLTDNTFVIDGISGLAAVKVDQGKVVSITGSNVTNSDITVIKKSAVVSPVDRIFTGSYLRSDGTTLHQNFFYRFIGGNKYEAGFNPGQALRTETYRPIGNIAAWVIHVSDNAAHQELLLFIDGTLKVSYMETERIFHHGSFSEAPQ